VRCAQVDVAWIAEGEESQVTTRSAASCGMPCSRQEQLHLAKLMTTALLLQPSIDSLLGLVLRGGVSEVVSQHDFAALWHCS
jgi:hypothetical protein